MITWDDRAICGWIEGWEGGLSDKELKRRKILLLNDPRRRQRCN